MLGVVRGVELLGRKKRSIVTLLKFDCLDTAIRSHADQRLRSIEAPAVIAADLSDDEWGLVIRNPVTDSGEHLTARDPELSWHGAILALAQLPARAEAKADHTSLAIPAIR